LASVFLVGIAVKFFGRGKTAVFGISSAVLALIGCVLGNLFFYAGFIAREEGASFFEVFFFFLFTPAALIELFSVAFEFMDVLFFFFLFTPAALIELFSVAFEFMDVLFYGLAAWVGFSTAMDMRRARR